MALRISLPMRLLLVIVGVLLLGNLVPVAATQFFFTISLVFKELLGFLLPFVIFSFVLSGILSLKSRAPLILGILIASVFLSNFVVALATYGAVIFLAPSLIGSMATDVVGQCAVVKPLFAFNLPTLIRSEHALLLALGLGILGSFKRWPQGERMVMGLKSFIEKFLLNYFIPLLPLYVVGFLLKMNYEGVFVSLIQQYSGAFILIVAIQLSFLAVYYFLAAHCSWDKALHAIKNALPSYLTAFGTMSSTATVPVSVECAVKNTHNRPLAQVGMPIMANVHLLGDSISTPILAIISMHLFLGYVPNFTQYFVFVLYFGISMFAVSGIPGGGIIVMIPILKSVLGFTPSMISLITALYLLLDSFGTAANVMGDGALIMVINRILKKFGISSE
ncbi:dicarboxylate/amino acid:cation symporter [Candidatus Babeliales bacterium]|nr:dicarboxylate/amino acid:cation symporter [Candidatus Babeliales bacterium]